MAIEKEFTRKLYNSRKNRVSKFIKDNYKIKHFDKIAEQIIEKIKNLKEEETFSFFTDKFKKDIVYQYYEDDIWKWCLFNAGLQYHFLDGENNFGVRLRGFNSITLNNLLMEEPELIKNKENFIFIIQSSDINLKEERILTLNKLFDFTSIRNEVFTEDPLFKKGFLATMFYNDILNKKEFIEGPCVDYHLLTWFKNNYNLKIKDNETILETRIKIWYILMRIYELSDFDYQEIDNRIFKIARNKNKNKNFEYNRTTWF